MLKFLRFAPSYFTRFQRQYFNVRKIKNPAGKNPAGFSFENCHQLFLPSISISFTTISVMYFFSPALEV